LRSRTLRSAPRFPPIADGGSALTPRRAFIHCTNKHRSRRSIFRRVCAFRDCAAQVFVNGDRVSIRTASILLRPARANPSQGGGAKLPVCQTQIAGLPTMALSFWRELTSSLLAACSTDYIAVIRKCYL